MKFNKLWMLLFVPMLFAACSNNENTSTAADDENAQQVGDTMASMDEAGGQDGNLSSLIMEKGVQKTFLRLTHQDFTKSSWKNFFGINEANATSCFLTVGAWGACSGTAPTFTQLQTFNDCTILGGTYSGNVSLTWHGATITTCQLEAMGDTIVRIPNFTVTGLRGATMTVDKTGSVGQTFTLTSAASADPLTFMFANDGIHRVFSDGTNVLFDFTTKVSDPITITGATRLNRVVNGGTLEVTNNTTAVTCSYTPSSVTWNSSSCNCAESGSWTATCSDTTTRKLEITGCGTANYSIGGVSSGTVTFDRCVQL